MRTVFPRGLVALALLTVFGVAAGSGVQKLAAKQPRAVGEQPTAAPPIIVPRPVIEGGLFKRTVVPGISELRESVAGLALVDINTCARIGLAI